MASKLLRPGRALLCGLGLILLSAPALAQDEPAATGAAPTTQPAAPERQPVLARVIEVRGDAQYAPLDGSDWQPVTVDLLLPEQTQIRTGLRSAVKLQVGDEEPYTALVIESVGKVVLSEVYKTTDTKRVRIGVGYGRIRAGVAEGGLQSDFTVDSPVATLSKRGTWNFGLSYTRGTDEFDVFLMDYGLVEALNKITQERRTLLPREVVTEAMRRWADEVMLRRNVPVADILGQSDILVAFNRLSNDGLGVTGPGQGQTVFVNLSNASARSDFFNQANRALDTTPPIIRPPAGDGPFRRPEGYFGSGHGDELIPVIISETSDLAKSGAARPGTYRIRRAALENWVQQNRR
jgi:hypothetical protein